MYTLIDLHCHMLFGVDDGATDLNTTKKMLEIAYNDGIKTICFTPHFKIHHFKDDEEIMQYNNKIVENFRIVEEYAKKTFPDLNLHLGNEIMYHSDICDSISREKCRSIVDSKYILIEFRHNTSDFDIKNSVMNLTRKGYIPVIAHVERYSAFSKSFSFFEEIKDLGAMMQINSNSITKFKIGKTARFISKVLKKQLADIVATDAHDEKAIIPCLSKAQNKIEKRYGKEYAKKLFHDNPAMIITND